MRERWVAGHKEGNKAYEFSYETIVYLLDTYHRWFPIKNDEYFLLKITDNYIKIETDFERIKYPITVNKNEYCFSNDFVFDWIELPRKFLTCLWYAHTTWNAQNTSRTPLYKHRFYLSIINNLYIIDCRQHLDYSKGWMAMTRLPGIDATLSFTFEPICMIQDDFYIRSH